MRYDNYKIDVLEQLKSTGGLTRHVQSSIDLLCDILNRLSMPSLLRTIDVFSIRTIQERALVKKFVGQFDMFPSEAKGSSLLLMEKGKLLFTLGDFTGAAHDFSNAAVGNYDKVQRGICRFNQFQALVQLGKYTEALQSYQEAITSCPDQCELFDSNKYKPEKVLGSRIWGVIFLCKTQEKSYMIQSLVSQSESNLAGLAEVKKLLDGIENPYLLKILEIGKVAKNNNPYIVHDYIPNVLNIREYIVTNGEIVEGKATPFLKKVAEGMAAPQSKEMMHGDLKPGNVFVQDQEGVLIPIIMNWGLSLERERLKEYHLAMNKVELAPNNNLAEDILESVEFRAPEQRDEAIEGSVIAPGHFSDTYSFGKLSSYTLFKTTRPYPQQWEKLMQGEELREVVETCCLENPKKRYQNFKTLASHFSVYRLGYKHYIKNEFTDAIRYFKRAIKNENDSLAKFALYLIYKSGRVGQVLYAKAEMWKKKAFEHSQIREQIEDLGTNGDIIAQTMMGYIFYFGIQQPLDPHESLTWFQRSADKCPIAQTFIGHIYRKGFEGIANMYEAFTCYKKAANKDYAPAQFMLGIMCFYGLGTEQDFSTAIKWYEKAAEKDYPAAQTQLGYLYRHGLDTVEDYDLAQAWIEKGLPQDFNKALYWFNKATQLGDPTAQTNLACMYLFGIGVTPDVEKAIELLQQAAAKDYPLAQYALVYLNRYGLGVKQNHGESFKWLKRATMNADSETRKFFESILKQRAAKLQ